ncbi:MAG TPA: murein L,D-transpeptidase family protein [Xanthobacteraceae bacterium]|nr:murein L,D-transpeptidase family protein [Xanthobacteraceae bacterium]
MKLSRHLRGLLTSAALCAVLALAGCDTDGLDYNGKAMKSLSPEMMAQLQQMNMPTESPILVRLFKEEAELEVWKQDAAGRYQLLKTYPICRWSGELGPKVKEGDRQAPEGFYAITPGQMNPNSAYYLSFNIGYPNAYDRAWGRSGSQLMVHGDCSSRGCYAMTDDQIGEIYALARESFFGGQRAFQVQALPFRMTPTNLARHRNNPNMPFWRMLKEGTDLFEVTHKEPQVNVCEKRYVFNVDSADDTTQNDGIKLGTPWGGFRDQQTQASPHFNPVGKCPVYPLPADVMASVKQKQHEDDQQAAALASRVTLAPIRTGRDGGMHPTFLAKLRPQEVRESDGTVRYVVDESAAKKLGSYVNPPLETYPDAAPAGTTAVVANTQTSTQAKPKPDQKTDQKPDQKGATYMTAAAESRPAPTPPARASLFASVSDGQSDGLFGRMKSFFVGDEKPVPTAPVASATKQAPPPKPAHPRPAQAAAVRPKPQTEPQSTQPAPQQQQQQPQQQSTDQAQPSQQTAARPASGASLMSGATPVVPAGNFDNRWGAVR